MVFDSLENSAKYESLHPAFKQAFDYVKSTDFSRIELGKVLLDGKNLFVNYAECETKTVEAAKMETHNEYIDIQIPLTQPEVIGYTPACNLKEPIDAYNAEKDITFFKDQGQTMLTIKPGQFVIFWPEDGHQPGIGDGPWRKVIVKVKI